MKKLILFALLTGVLNTACATESTGADPVAMGNCPTTLRCQIYSPGNVGCSEVKNFHITRMGDFAGAANYRILELEYYFWKSGGRADNGNVTCRYKQPFNNKGMTGSVEYQDNFSGNAYPWAPRGAYTQWTVDRTGASCGAGLPLPGNDCVTAASK